MQEHRSALWLPLLQSDVHKIKELTGSLGYLEVFGSLVLHLVESVESLEVVSELCGYSKAQVPEF